MRESDLQPDTEDVVQVEPDAVGPPVTVVVAGPVRTQELPARGSGIRSWTVSDTAPQQLLWADPHRKDAQIVAIGQPILIARSREELSGFPGTWPASVPLTVSARDELWAQCATAAQTATVTVVQTQWAAG